MINDQANLGASLLVVIHLAFRIQSTTKKVTGPSYRACVARTRQMSGVVMSETSLPQTRSPSFSTCGAEPDVDSKRRRSVPVAVRQPTRQHRSRSRRRVRARNVFVSVPPTRSGTVHPSTTTTPVPEPLPMLLVTADSQLFSPESVMRVDLEWHHGKKEMFAVL